VYEFSRRPGASQAQPLDFTSESSCMVLTDDQKALQETARRFARQRLLPDYQKREKIGVMDRELIAEMGALGLLGVDLPEELGGLGVDAVTTGLIAEELAYGDFNISAVPVGISLNAAILMRHAQSSMNGCHA
jgi:cyclohexanecarboxyl-CoA dehydrogenase